MKKILLLLLLCFPFALEKTTVLEQDHAYIISAISTIEENPTITNATFSITPQVIIYDGTSKYIGSATKFTGCYEGVEYQESAPIRACGAMQISGIAAENIKAGVTVSYGLEGGTQTQITGTFTSDATASANEILTGYTAYVNGEKVEGTLIANSSCTVEELARIGVVTSGTTYETQKDFDLIITSVGGADNGDRNVASNTGIEGTGTLVYDQSTYKTTPNTTSTTRVTI